MSGEPKDGQAKPGSISGPLFIIAMGLAVLFGSWAASVDAAYYLELDKSGVRVDADVKQTRTFDTGHGSNRSAVYVADVQFTTSSGESITGEAAIGEERYDDLRGKKSAKLRIVYLAKEPKRFRYEELNARESGEARIVSWVMRIIGGSLLFLGLLLGVKHLRRKS